MKKHHTARKFALSAVASALLAMPAFADNNLLIEQKPLLGVTDVSPAVVVALSIEFPTAYVANSETNEFTPALAAQKHLGYFDSDRCYQYVVTTSLGTEGGMGDYLHTESAGDSWRGFLGDGYFEDSGPANNYLCSGERDWSGNMLNFMTMSALDIFRQTLTGGNRAKGVGGGADAYAAGDPVGEKTYLRRAMLWRGQEDGDIFPNKTGQDQVGDAKTQYRYFSEDVYTTGLINDLVPHAFVAELSDTEKGDPDPIKKAGRGKDGHIAAVTQNEKCYRNAGRNSTTWTDCTGDSWETNNIATGSVSGVVSTNSSELDSLKELPAIKGPDNKPNLVFWNSGTGFYATLYRSYGKPESLQSSERLYSVRNNTTKGSDTKATWFNVVVEKKHESGKKPKGLLQKYAQDRKMRVAVMSYLTGKGGNCSGHGNGASCNATTLASPDGIAMDGGVLRVPMKNISGYKYYQSGDETTVVKEDLAEWNKDTGVLEPGDTALNYINQFGDNNPYDTRDPVAELYYTAVRYLRHGAWKDGADDSYDKTPAYEDTYPTTITDSMTGGFNVETEWDDPLNPNNNLREAMCYAPTIITIGDTQTHADGNIPNMTYEGVSSQAGIGYMVYNGSHGEVYNGTEHTRPKDNVAKENNTVYGGKTYTNSYELVHDIQGSSFPWNAHGGSTGSPSHSPIYGMAGMAYWVHTHNVRPDVTKAVRTDALGRETGREHKVYIQNFFVDVMESGNKRNWAGKYIDKDGKEQDANGQTSNLFRTDLKGNASQVANPYYLAGKFGGFNYDDTSSKSAAEQAAERKNWLDDTITNEYYTDGMPSNFAIANNPENMVKALTKAFETVGFPRNTMQSALQFNNAEGKRLDLTTATGSGKYRNADFNDEKIYNELITRAKEGTLPLTFRAGYRTSDWSGYLTANVLFDYIEEITDEEGKKHQRRSIREKELWNAGTLLKERCHKANGCAEDRTIQAKPASGGEAIDFTKANASEFSTLIEGATIDEYVSKDDNGALAKTTENFWTALNEGRAASERVTSADLIAYLRGDNSNEGQGKMLRTRKESLMGTSVYASVTPILHNTSTKPVTGVPKTNPELKVCYYGKGDNKLRTEDYIATSSNDGLFHIFDMTGQEVYAYIPQTAMPHLANFANPNYQHRFVNDGTATLHEVCEGDDAKTYIVGTTGRGGSSIYVIDVTEPNNFKAITEINSTNEKGEIGILVSAPIVVNDGTGKSVLVFSSGYNNKSDKGYLYFYDLKTGTPIAQVELGKSGVGSPFGFDSNNNGAVDRIYVGDNEGKLWRVSIGTEKDENGNPVETDWKNPVKTPLFAGEGRPITSRPFAATVGGKTVILVGTGEYFSLDEVKDTTQQNYAYGFFDDGVTEEITVGELQEQVMGNLHSGLSFTDETNREVELLQVTRNGLCASITDKCPVVHKGWKLKLPEGFVITSDSGFYGSENQLATYTATRVDKTLSTQCEVSGATMFVAVDSQTGGAYNNKVFDEPVLNDKDDPGLYSSEVYYNTMVTAVTTTQYDSDSGGGGIGAGSSGSDDVKPPLDPELNGNKMVQVRRISWREIF